MSSITTPHGVFSYEAADDYTVSESPDLKSYEVVFKDEVIGLIDLNYHTSKGCSNRYGWVDVRDCRSGWTYSQFDAEIFPQMRTDRDRNGNATNRVHPSSAITAEFLPDRFRSIKQAFKFCVKKICEHLDSVAQEEALPQAFLDYQSAMKIVQDAGLVKDIDGFLDIDYVAIANLMKEVAE